MLQALKKIFQRGGLGQTDVLGIELSPEGVCVATLSVNTGVLSLFDSRQCAPGEWQSCLKALVKQHDLSGKDSYFTLHPKYYNMLLIDAPEVNDEELAEAVRWKVKDLITQPLDDVVVDVFRLPAEAYRGRMNMIYTTIVEKQLITKIVEMSEEAGLELQSIGINELSICQYGKRLASVENLGVAFVTLEEDGGVINLTENGLLYLSRSIDVGLKALSAGESVGGITLDTSSKLDALALDIQRSLDYYESQLGKPAAGKIIFLPTHKMLHRVVGDLKDKVSVSVGVLDLPTEFLKNAESLEENEGEIKDEVEGGDASFDTLNGCFNAIGATLTGCETLKASLAKEGG